MARFGKRFRVALFGAVLLWPTLTLAQITTGSISGTIVDPSGQVIPEAKVYSGKREDGRRAHGGSTNETGAFNFSALQPGTYTLKIERQGFRGFERKGLVLTANDRLSVGNVALVIGEVTQTVSVSAEGALVQTGSSENSELFSSNQLNLIQTRGRTSFRCCACCQESRRESSAADRTPARTNRSAEHSEALLPTFPVRESNWNTFTLDGQIGSDADIVNVFNGSTSVDAVEEVKVLANNYQAEYGRNSGPTVNIISKAGTRDFHGGAVLVQAPRAVQRQRLLQQPQRTAQTPLSLQHLWRHDRRSRSTFPASSM